MRLPPISSTSSATAGDALMFNDALPVPCGERKEILSGVLFWLVFGILLVIVRGVRWDENYEFAQVLLGQIPYPPDHPLAQYLSHLFSGQTYALAALMHFFPGPLLANSLRNYAALTATILPVYLLSTQITRSAVWGHIAVLFILMGVHVSFFGTYPVQVLPGLYTNGMVGQGYAFFILWLFIRKREWAALFLAGLMPVVHLGQFPPIFIFAGLFIAWTGFSRRRFPLVSLAVISGGLLVSVALYALQRRFALPVPDTGPYAGTLGALEAFQSFMQHHASHREIPLGTGHIPLIGLVLAGVILMLRRKSSLESGTSWLWGYGLIVALIVWGTMTIHFHMGNTIPQFLIAWMPYRLMNHAGPLLICVVLGLMAQNRENEGRVLSLTVALLSLCALRPVAELLLPANVYARYLASGEGFFFILCGIGFSIGADNRKGIAIALMICVISLAFWHQFGAFCMFIGSMVGVVTLRFNSISAACSRIHLVNAALALSCLILLIQGYRHREHLPLTESEHLASNHLEKTGEVNAMILVRHQQEGLQARLHHPVMTDMATMTWIPYYPALGPGLDKMYRELYGVQLAPHGNEKVSDQPWYEVWPAKSESEWRQLGKEYSFKYIYAPSFMHLNLTPVTHGKTDVLYRIPD